MLEPSKSKCIKLLSYVVIVSVFLLYYIHLTISIVTLFVSSLINAQLDFGEGFILGNAWRLVKGINIYDPRNLMNVIPYPPLFYIVVSPLTILARDIALPLCRLISLIFYITAVSLSVSIGRIIVKPSNKWLDFIFTFISFSVFFTWGGIASWCMYCRVDGLALLFNTLALYFIIKTLIKKDEKHRYLYITFASVFSTLALLTRQQYFTLVITAFIIALINRKDKKFSTYLNMYLVITLSVTTILFLLINILTKNGFLLHILYLNAVQISPENIEFSLSRIISKPVVSKSFILLFMTLLATFIYRVYLSDSNRNSLYFIHVYFSLAIILNVVLQVLKPGAASNYVLETLILIVMETYIFLTAVSTNKLKTLTLLGLLTITLLLSPSPISQPASFSLIYEKETCQLSLIISKIPNNYLIISDDVYPMYLANRTTIVETFITSQLIKRNIITNRTLINMANNNLLVVIKSIYFTPRLPWLIRYLLEKGYKTNNLTNFIIYYPSTLSINLERHEQRTCSSFLNYLKVSMIPNFSLFSKLSQSLSLLNILILIGILYMIISALNKLNIYSDKKSYTTYHVI